MNSSYSVWSVLIRKCLSVGFDDFVAQLDDGFQRFAHGFAVVLFFSIRQILVRNQTRMQFFRISANWPERPAILDSLQCPDFVRVLCQAFKQRLQRGRKHPMVSVCKLSRGLTQRGEGGFRSHRLFGRCPR